MLLQMGYLSKSIELVPNISMPIGQINREVESYKCNS